MLNLIMVLIWYGYEINRDHPRYNNNNNLYSAMQLLFHSALQ